MQWSNTDFSAAVGRSSLPEHHPSGCRTALSRCVPCSSAEGAPAAFPCSPSHQGRDSWCVRHFLTSAVSSRLLTASTECFGIFLPWKCSKEVLKNQTQLLGMQWEVSGLGSLLSLCRVLAWEISWLQCHPFPLLHNKNGEVSGFSCLFINRYKSPCPQSVQQSSHHHHNWYGQASDSVFTFWGVCESRSQDNLMFGSRLSVLCSYPWRSHFSCLQVSPQMKLHHKPEQFRKADDAKMEMMSTHVEDKPLGSFTVSFSHFNQNKDLKKVSLYFPLVWSFGFFKTFRCFLGLACIM